MSLREKTAWICLGTTVLVLGPYFVYMGRLYVGGALRPELALGPFIGAVVLQVILTGAAMTVAALTSRNEPKDERDAAIEAKATRVGYWVFAALCMTSVLAVMAGSLAIGTTAAERMHVAAVCQLFLFCFVAAEATRFLTEGVGYRRGA